MTPTGGRERSVGEIRILVLAKNLILMAKVLSYGLVDQLISTFFTGAPGYRAGAGFR